MLQSFVSDIHLCCLWVSRWTDRRMSLLYQRKIWMKAKMTHRQTKTAIPSSVPASPGDTSPGPWGKAGGYEGKQSRKNIPKMTKMKILRTIQAENLVSVRCLRYIKYSVLGKSVSCHDRHSLVCLLWSNQMSSLLVKAVCYLFCCEYSAGNWCWVLGSGHFK